MDITKITNVKELKALAYDELVKKEQAEHNLRLINARIGEVLEAQEPTVADEE